MEENECFFRVAWWEQGRKGNKYTGEENVNTN